MQHIYSRLARNVSSLINDPPGTPVRVLPQIQGQTDKLNIVEQGGRKLKSPTTVEDKHGGLKHRDAKTISSHLRLGGLNNEITMHGILCWKLKMTSILEP